MHNIIIVIRARIKDMEHLIPTVMTSLSPGLKGTNWAETTGHTGSNDTQPGSPQMKTKPNRIKPKKYGLLCTYAIHT